MLGVIIILSFLIGVFIVLGVMLWYSLNDSEREIFVAGFLITLVTILAGLGIIAIVYFKWY